MDYNKERVQRNLNPHAEAVYAMGFYGKRYASLGCGSMDFWDRLTSWEKKFCTEQVKKIKQTKSKHSSYTGKTGCEK